MRFNLKCARRVKRLNQDEMAKILDISKSFYYKIENGSRNPSLKLAFKIADVLEHNDIKELFEMKEEVK